MYENAETIARWTGELKAKTTMDPVLYDAYGVKRGLRDKNGKGVLAGLTEISQVQGKQLVDGKEVPCEGKLCYRGYSIFDLVRGESARKHCLAEECAYLIAVRQSAHIRHSCGNSPMHWPRAGRCPRISPGT